MDQLARDLGLFPSAFIGRSGILPRIKPIIYTTPQGLLYMPLVVCGAGAKHGHYHVINCLDTSAPEEDLLHVHGE